ncbi:rhodanese-like domain-containing protein [Puteibacter caeruleilacunae]|nr:rhodanese-like domain-containing protein [Puteibacter caeruleilacunae]
MNKNGRKKTGIAKSLFEVICALGQKRKFRKISASEFFEMTRTKKDITIIDCRDKEDYAEGHIDGAINIPYQIFMKNWQKATKTKIVVTVCYLGIYGRAAAQKIARSGNHTAYTVIGGMQAVDKLNQ